MEKHEHFFRQGIIDNIPQGNPANKAPYCAEQDLDMPYLLGTKRQKMRLAQIGAHRTTSMSGTPGAGSSKTHSFF